MFVDLTQEKCYVLYRKGPELPDHYPVNVPNKDQNLVMAY